MYDICYTKSVADRKAYIEYIDEQYNAEKLTSILNKVCEIIGANILNIAVQDYDPQGEYLKHWLPELADIPVANIHQPYDFRL